MAMVSIVIPTFNRASLLEECIISILKQSYTDYEIIVIDDGSTDNTLEILGKYAQVYKQKIIFVEQERKGPAAARNKGISLARGEIILFIDDDVVTDKDWIKYIISDFSQPDVGIVGGRTLLKRLDKFNVLYYDNGFSASANPSYIPTNNAAFLKEALNKVYDFDSRFIYPGLEDADICLRIRKIGYRLKLNNNAVVYHYENYSFKGWLEKNYQYGYGNSTFLDLHAELRVFCPYYYLCIFPLVLRDAARFVRTYYVIKKKVGFMVIVSIFNLACLQRLFYTIGQLAYILNNKKYKLLFYKLRTI